MVLQEKGLQESSKESVTVPRILYVQNNIWIRTYDAMTLTSPQSLSWTTGYHWHLHNLYHELPAIIDISTIPIMNYRLSLTSPQSLPWTTGYHWHLHNPHDELYWLALISPLSNPPPPPHYRVSYSLFTFNTSRISPSSLSSLISPRVLSLGKA